MLKFGNKEFRNLQEQVEENMQNIEKLKNGQAVLDEFGIKVIGEVSDIEDLPTVAEYKESTPDWEYGDTFAVGTDAPYTLYILTRANETHEADYWFDIGEFPAPGPQGPQGPQGPEGQQGPTGPSGADGAAAGFGTPTATATMTTRGSAPTVNITSTGPNTEKVFNFDFYLPVATPRVTITSASGTLTLAEYNILFNFEDSVVVFKPSSSLANNAYTLQRWYSSDDYIVFICLYNYTPYKTGVYRCRIDRSNRNYLIYADEAIKINKYNISSAIDSSTNEAAGTVLTADGNGGATWATVSGGSEVVTLTTTVGNLSDADYLKVAGDNCVIIYDDNTTKVSFRKYNETATTITYAMPLSEGSSTYVYGVEITKATKYYQVQSAYMPISVSNIKSGSTIADKYLKTNGSGGATWSDPPAQVQSDWNQTSQSSPAFIKNKPTIPTVPVQDVTVNGTSVMDGTTAKVLVDTVDGTTDGTNWTSLTINGTTAAIPTVDYPVTDVEVDGVSVVSSGVASITMPTFTQAQANWTESDNTKVDYIKNKPSLATVATSGSYTDLSDKPTIPDTTYMVTTNTTQTISGLKTFTSEAKFDIINVGNRGRLDADGEANQFRVIANAGTDLELISQDAKTVRIKNLTGDYGLVIPSTVAFLADKTIATTDQIPSVPVQDVQINGTSILSSGNANILTNTAYNASSNKIATMSDLPSVPVQDVKVNGSSVVSSGDAILGTAALCDSTANVTSGSSALVTSGAVYTSVSAKLDATACTYQTTAPTAAISDGGVHIVYLSAEPATKYSGYIYMIAEA